MSSLFWVHLSLSLEQKAFSLFPAELVCYPEASAYKLVPLLYPETTCELPAMSPPDQNSSRWLVITSLLLIIP